MIKNEEAISILNNLIEISKDGEEGVLKAADSIDDSKLQAYLLRRSLEVKHSAIELQGLVRSLGGKPADSASIGGYLHPRWVDLKAAILTNDKLTVRNEIERGEDVALKTYRDATSRDLPSEAVLIVLRQLNGAQRNHDEVKQLRDAVKLQIH